MSLSINGYTFSGPFTDIKRVHNRSGVFILVSMEDDGSVYALDVDDSETVRVTIEDHPRQECWRQHRTGRLGVLVFYTPDLPSNARKKLVRAIRLVNDVPCGTRH